MIRVKHIYFLRPVGVLGPIKIGASSVPSDRLRAYQIWSPVELEMAACVAAHCNVEMFLHRHFISDWKHGEWFEWSEELQSLIDHINKFECLPAWVDEPRNPTAFKRFLAKYPKGKTKRMAPSGALA